MDTKADNSVGDSKGCISEITARKKKRETQPQGCNSPTLRLKSETHLCYLAPESCCDRKKLISPVKEHKGAKTPWKKPFIHSMILQQGSSIRRQKFQKISFDSVAPSLLESKHAHNCCALRSWIITHFNFKCQNLISSCKGRRQFSS